MLSVLRRKRVKPFVVAPVVQQSWHEAQQSAVYMCTPRVLETAEKNGCSFCPLEIDCVLMGDASKLILSSCQGTVEVKMIKSNFLKIPLT